MLRSQAEAVAGVDGVCQLVVGDHGVPEETVLLTTLLSLIVDQLLREIVFDLLAYLLLRSGVSHFFNLMGYGGW